MSGYIYPVVRDSISTVIQTEVERLRAELAEMKKNLEQARELIQTFVEADRMNQTVPVELAERDRQDAAVGRAVLSAYRPGEFRTPGNHHRLV